MKRDFDAASWQPDPGKFPGFTRLMDILKEQHGGEGPVWEVISEMGRASAAVVAGYVDGPDFYKDGVMSIAALCASHGMIDIPAACDAHGGMRVEVHMAAQQIRKGIIYMPVAPEFAQGQIASVVAYQRHIFEQVAQGVPLGVSYLRMTLEEMESKGSILDTYLLPAVEAPGLENRYRETFQDLRTGINGALMAAALNARSGGKPGIC